MPYFTNRISGRNDYPEMQNELQTHLFGDKAILITSEIGDYRHCLYPEERQILGDAIEKRVHEFSTGRFCAHQALRKIGIDNFPVLKGNHREPIWPDNVVGSISHCRDLAGAVVADKRQVRSVGLDIENIKPLDTDIARHICIEEEKQWVAKQAFSHQNQALLLIFSLKEAIFKCIYQAAGLQLQFKQCRISPELENGTAKADLLPTAIRRQSKEIDLNFVIAKTHIYSTARWNYLPAVG
jgi:4'-phosphopantetheinyl transferase EntD